MTITGPVIHSFYVVRNNSGKFFAGFNAGEGRANFVDEAYRAKMFTNKFEVKLRPTETLVELKCTMSSDTVEISEPFRPHRKSKPE